MKRNLSVALFLMWSLAGMAKVYYVAPSGGSDYYPGTITQPWATWQRAFNVALAGDTVYFRGGVWYPSSAYQGDNITYMNPSTGAGHNGLPGKPICFFNYPGEEPVLDCKNVHATGNFLTGLMMYDTHWLHFRGLTIRNVYQRKADIEPKGVCGYPVSNMIFENITVNNIGGCGWYMESDVNVRGYDLGWDGSGYIPYDTTRYINCDTYQCCDTFRVNPGQTPGNMADGFKFIGVPGGYLSYEGCRAWHCSDDGFDIPYGPKKVLNNCWSFNHTYSDYNFEGNGYKLSSNAVPPTAGAIVTNCIAAYNDIGIFEADYDYRQRARIYNNTIYKCGVGIQLSNNIEYPNSLSIFKNNIIHACTTQDAAGRPYIITAIFYYEESNNTWDYSDEGSVPHFKTATDVTVTDADFISLDVSQLSRARKSDHSLPDVDCLKLAPGSDLIDKGTFSLPDLADLPYYTPRSFYGSAPDLGYAEYTTAAPAVPVYVSSVVENATPTKLEISFTLTLTNIVPPVSAFTVMVNNVSRTVSSVTVSGTKVTLTLSEAVVEGDVVTVAYTKPASNPLQTVTGGIVETMGAKNVINNCSSVANLPPAITITSPTKNLTFTAPATVSIVATASDPDGSVVKVEFYNGSVKLGEQTTAPFSYTWKSVPEGTYVLTAIATDDKSSRTVSDAVTVVVLKAATTVNQYPVVRVTTPNNKVKFKKNEKVTITADASDPDGVVSKVEFFNGTLKIGEDTDAPFTLALETEEEGTYNITASATDNLGATTKSAVLAIVIDAMFDINSDNVTIYPNPNDGNFTMTLLTSLPFDQSNVTITNLAGKRVFNGTMEPDQTLKEFDVSAAAPGAYVLMITSGNTVVAAKKFIKR